MGLYNYLKIISLAMIWSFSFIFMRLLAPVLGPILTSNLRILIAGVVLIIYFKIIKLDVEFKKYFKHYLILGVFNCAVPFCLFSFAALHLHASNSAILNACVPFFAAIFSYFWLSEPLTKFRVSGLVLGFVGVILISKASSISHDSMFILATLACVLATICYALSGIYVKKFAYEVNPVAIAGISSMLGGVAMIPANYFNGPVGEVTPTIILMLIIFAVFCSGVAFILFYKLLQNIGPTKTATVTFLIPVFGMFWGNILLNEQITKGMLLGCLFILAGVYLIFKRTKAS